MTKCPATQLTLRELRKDWPLVEVVERWVPFPPPGHRADLAGLFDVLCVRKGEVLGVQCTSRANVSARIRKMRANPKLAVWIESGLRAEVWGWAKRGNRWVAERSELKREARRFEAARIRRLLRFSHVLV